MKCCCVRMHILSAVTDSPLVLTRRYPLLAFVFMFPIETDGILLRCRYLLLFCASVFLIGTGTVLARVGLDGRGLAPRSATGAFQRTKASAAAAAAATIAEKVDEWGSLVDKGVGIILRAQAPAGGLPV